MIVVDASVFVEALSNSVGGAATAIGQLTHDTFWVAPEPTRLEIANALRGLWLGGSSSDDALTRHLDGLARLEFAVAPTAPLLPRIRELAPNATAYDAAYLALAESLHVPLLTYDHKLAKVPGISAEVRVISR